MLKCLKMLVPQQKQVPLSTQIPEILNFHFGPEVYFCIPELNVIKNEEDH